MNGLGKRLDALAARATTEHSLADPSLANHSARNPPTRRGLALGLVATLLVTAMLFVWQTSDRSTTSVAAGEGGEPVAQQQGSPCNADPLMNVLRSGLPELEYVPAGSYQALADSSSAVVSGTVVAGARAQLNGASFIELMLEDVVELATGVARPDIDVIAYIAVWNDGENPDPLADWKVPDGLKAVGFVNPWSGVRPGWNPGFEGLYIGCGMSGPLQAVIADAAGGVDPVNPTHDQLRSVLSDAGKAQPGPTEPSAAEPAASDEQDELQQAQIAAAQAQWEAARVQDYRLVYREARSQGSSIPMTLRVEGGQVVDAEFFDAFGESDRTWTVDDMYAAIASADIVREFEIDATTGAPIVLSLDPDRTVSGDEFAFRDIQLISQAALDDAYEVLVDWLPEPEPVSDELRSFLEPSSTLNADLDDQIYVLHRVADLDVFLYLEDGQVCIAAAHATDTERTAYTGFSSTCRWTTDFLSSPIRLAQVAGEGNPFLLVVPPLDVANQDWSVEGQGGDLDVGERSALLTVDGPAAPGRERILFNCECGDRIYILSN